MYSLTSDLDDIINNIQEGIISNYNVRIISSNLPHPFTVISSFPNIEEVHCNLICKHDDFPQFEKILLEKENLTRLSVIVYIPREETTTDSPPAKRRRIVSSEADKIITMSIPTILSKLGDRCKYISITFTVVDDNLNYATLIKLNKGFLYVNSLYGDNTESVNVFQTLKEINCLKGLRTDGDIVYDISGLKELNLLTIDPKIIHINKAQLQNLVSIAKKIKIKYTHKNFETCSTYSTILLAGTKGQITQINAIIPSIDVEEHIALNDNLELIHTVVYDEKDVELLEEVIKNNKNRTITYYIHYYNVMGIDYWSRLRNNDASVEIIFKDIIKTLMI